MSVRLRDLVSSSNVRVRASSDGFIVLGLLIVIVGAVVTGVMIGKIVHGARYHHEVPLGHRELRVATRSVEVRYGSLVTARLDSRQSAWVRAVGDGRLAVFHDRDSPRVVGFVAESDLVLSTAGVDPLR